MSGAGSAWSSCGRSRCRPTRGWRWCRPCWCGPWSPASGRQPYAGDLVRWGTELHDRFLLPWYVAADIADVVDDLRAPRARVRADLAGSVPRVPVPSARVGAGGRHHHRAAHRHRAVARARRGGRAGRAPPATSTRRSSGSRSRWPASPKAATWSPATDIRSRCIRTERAGTFVAGVRYKAWKPPSALHPTIGVHAPLVFDLIDRWNGRSLGGCTYHVSHPGGRAYDRLPVNANEAEARRASRFDTPAATRPARSTWPLSTGPSAVRTRTASTLAPWISGACRGPRRPLTCDRHQRSRRTTQRLPPAAGHLRRDGRRRRAHP